MHEIVSGVSAMSSPLFGTSLLVNKTSTGNAPTVSRSVHIWLWFCSLHSSRASPVAYHLTPHSVNVLHFSVVFEDKDAEMGQILILYTVFPWCLVKVKVKLTLEQTTKAQRWSRGVALLFL